MWLIPLIAGGVGYAILLTFIGWLLPWLLLLPLLVVYGGFLTWRDRRRINKRYGRKIV